MSNQLRPELLEDLYAAIRERGLNSVKSEIETVVIELAMDECDGNCQKASKILGLTRTGLVEKRKKLGLKLNPAPRG